MNRQPLFIALLAAAVLLSLTGFAQEARTQGTLEERVMALEKELADTRAEMSALVNAATEDAATLDAVVRYLHEQSRGASMMVKTLATSETQGFTAGINFNSRETLLAGWREQLGLAQKGLPRKAGEKKDEIPAKPARRR